MNLSIIQIIKSNSQKENISSATDLYADILSKIFTGWFRLKMQYL